jgi:hypothetical protein
MVNIAHHGNRVTAPVLSHRSVIPARSFRTAKRVKREFSASRKHGNVKALASGYRYAIPG